MKRNLPLLCALLWFGTASAAVPPPSKLLPDDTLAVLTVPDFGKLRQIVQDSPQTQFYSDPAMKPIRDKFLDKLKSEFISPLEHEMGIHFDDFTSLPQGQLTIALVQDGWSGQEDQQPALLMLLDTRDKSAQLKTNLADLRKKWVDAGKPVKTQKIRDVDFSAITLTSNDLPKSLQKLGGNSATGAGRSDMPAGDESTAAKPKADSQLLYVGQSDSLLILGNSPKVIEKVLAAMSGGSVRTLDDLPAFSANYNALFRDAPIFGWINARALLDVVRHSDGGSRSAAVSGGPSPQAILGALGLNGLKSVAFSYLISNDGARFNLMLGVPEDERAGLFKILAGVPKDSSPPPFVPADAVSFQRWRIDLQKSWDTLRQMAMDAYPSAGGMVDFLLNSADQQAKAKDPSFDIRKDFFGNLGDDVITYSKSPRAAGPPGLAAPAVLYLVGSPDADRLVITLNTLMAMSGVGSAPTEREFLGRKIYTITPPATGLTINGRSSPPPSPFTFAASGGYVAMGSDTPMLEEYLRSGDGQGKSLRDLPGLSAATQKVSGSGMSIFGYSNEGETMRTAFNALKQSAQAPAGPDGMDALQQSLGLPDFSLKQWLDFSLLPDFEKVARYFSFSVYSACANHDGMTFTGFSPIPPPLKK